jgi:hypothetical protein
MNIVAHAPSGRAGIGVGRRGFPPPPAPARLAAKASMQERPFKITCNPCYRSHGSEDVNLEEREFGVPIKLASADDVPTALDYILRQQRLRRSQFTLRPNSHIWQVRAHIRNPRHVEVGMCPRNAILALNLRRRTRNTRCVFCCRRLGPNHHAGTGRGATSIARGRRDAGRRRGSRPVAKTYISAFTQALADLGWSDGRNARVDLRWGGAANARSNVFSLSSQPSLRAVSRNFAAFHAMRSSSSPRTRSRGRRSAAPPNK